MKPFETTSLFTEELDRVNDNFTPNNNTRPNWRIAVRNLVDLYEALMYQDPESKNRRDAEKLFDSIQPTSTRQDTILNPSQTVNDPEVNHATTRPEGLFPDLTILEIMNQFPNHLGKLPSDILESLYGFIRKLPLISDIPTRDDAPAVFSEEQTDWFRKQQTRACLTIVGVLRERKLEAGR